MLKNLKKLLCLMLALLMVFSLFTACGRAVSDDSDDDSRESSVKKDKDVNDDEEEDMNSNDDEDQDDEDVQSNENQDDQDEDQNTEESAEPEASDDAGTTNVNITVDVPDGWTSSDDSYSVLSYTSKDSMSLFNIMESYSYDKASPLELAQYEQEQIKEYFEDAAFQEPEKMKINGVEAARMSLEIEITKSMTQRQVYVYLFKGSEVYKVMGAYMTNDTQGEADVEAMIESIKFN